jgi:hypothetical protein
MSALLAQTADVMDHGETKQHVCMEALLTKILYMLDIPDLRSHDAILQTELRNPGKVCDHGISTHNAT